MTHKVWRLRVYDDCKLIGYVTFDPEDEDNWLRIGSEGSGPDGYYGTQGYRYLYASQTKTKQGKRIFVLHGTGWYPYDDGSPGLWSGTNAVIVDEERAREICDVEKLEYFFDLPNVLEEA